MLEINNKQLSQRLLIGQGTILTEEKAWTNNIESDSNQRWDIPLLAAVSMAVMTPINSAF
jgi:hypothetical protein